MSTLTLLQSLSSLGHCLGVLILVVFFLCIIFCVGDFRSVLLSKLAKLSWFARIFIFSFKPNSQPVCFKWRKLPPLKILSGTLSSWAATNSKSQKCQRSLIVSASGKRWEFQSLLATKSRILAKTFSLHSCQFPEAHFYLGLPWLLWQHFNSFLIGSMFFILNAVALATSKKPFRTWLVCWILMKVHGSEKCFCIHTH